MIITGINNNSLKGSGKAKNKVNSIKAKA